MKRILTTILALFGAMAMSLSLAGTAQAAPPTTYEAVTESPLLNVGVAVGLFSIDGFGGTTVEDGAVVAEVIGNPDASGIVIQKGGIVLTKLMGANAGETLTIKNIMYKTATGEVTAVINGERVLLYTAEQTSPTTSTMYVAEEGGLILQGFVDFFGLPAIGSEFGTSSLNAL